MGYKSKMRNNSRPETQGLFVNFVFNARPMKRLNFLIILIALFAACQQSDVVSDFTGNEATYDLQAGSAYNVSGTITFKERKAGKITAIVQLTGTDGNAKHPVHLHLGDISSPGADVALLLNSVEGSTGRSETTFSKLADESAITYKQLTDLSACVKIHLGDTGASRDVILAAGDVGMSFTKAAKTGRTGGVAVCKSE
jgi:hypothetical protein